MRQPAKGRKKLAPQVSFIVWNLVLLQEGYILLLKGQLFVVVLLGRDVAGDGGDIRFAGAEGSIPCLPGEAQVPFLADPF